MKSLLRTGLACLLLAGASVTAQAEPSTIHLEVRRAERLGWFDPGASLALLDTLQPQIHDEQTEVEVLTLRGFAAIDSRRDEQAQQTIERLQALADQGLGVADFSRHLVRAYFLRQSDRYEAARAELDS